MSDPKPVPPIRPNPRLDHRIDMGGGPEIALTIALVAISLALLAITALARP